MVGCTLAVGTPRTDELTATPERICGRTTAVGRYLPSHLRISLLTQSEMMAFSISIFGERYSVRCLFSELGASCREIGPLALNGRILAMRRNCLHFSSMRSGLATLRRLNTLELLSGADDGDVDGVDITDGAGDDDADSVGDGDGYGRAKSTSMGSTSLASDALSMDISPKLLRRSWSIPVIGDWLEDILRFVMGPVVGGRRALRSSVQTELILSTKSI